MTLAGGSTPCPLVHLYSVGGGRIAYVATSADVHLIAAVIDRMAGGAPLALFPPSAQAILTCQKKVSRWILHLMSDGDYAVDIRRSFALLAKVVGRYPDRGWDYGVVGTDAGVRISVSGQAKDRLLVFE